MMALCVGGPRSTPCSDRGGFALIGVLWIVVLISAVGIQLAVQARRISARVIHASEHSRAVAAAESGLALAREELQRRLDDQSLLAAGTSFGGAPIDPWFAPSRFLADTLHVGGLEVVVEMTDLGTRLNVNSAHEQELRLLFSGLRIDDGEADRLAQAIADWRDPDRLRRARGAERQEYIEADAAELPPDQPFGALAELRRVRGFTDEIAERVLPYLSVDGAGRINPQTAPIEVLRALPGMTEPLVREILRRRRSGEPVTDLLSMTSGLNEEARESVRRSLPLLMSRLTFGVEEVLVVSSAHRAGGLGSASATGVVVRVGEAAALTAITVR